MATQKWIQRTVSWEALRFLFFQLVDPNGTLKVPDTGKRLAREVSSSCLSFTSVSCKRIVADFRFLREFESTIAEPYSKPDNRNRSRTGTLLKMLLSQMDYSDRQSNQVPNISFLINYYLMTSQKIISNNSKTFRTTNLSEKITDLNIKIILYSI